MKNSSRWVIPGLLILWAALVISWPASARRCGDTYDGVYSQSAGDCVNGGNNCSGIVVCAY
jgi:hypothetical protein